MRAKRLRVGLAGLMLSAPVVAADTLESVDACMRANIPRTVQIKEVDLVATDRAGGKRQMRGRLYGTRENDRLRTMLKITAPSDLAGAAYLLRERDGGDEMYIYVPALQKVRRVTGASVDGSLWGTDFSYGDMKQINNAFSAAGSRLTGQDQHAGRAAHRLSLTPEAEAESRYSSIEVWVDQKTCVTLRADFHEGTSVRKRLESDPGSLRQAGAHWYAGEAVMSDLKEGTNTRLRVLGVSSDVDLAGRYFNPTTFYLGS